MNGTAMFVAVATLFIAQMNELQLSLGEIFTVWYVECCVILLCLISNTPLIVGKEHRSVL
jgi:Na+/H+-dicarboxylate symporter